MRTDNAALIEALRRRLPADALVLDPDVLAVISHDEAEWAAADAISVEQSTDDAEAADGNHRARG